MAWGVEARVPFLDRGFLDVAMAIDPAEKMIDKSKGEEGGVAEDQYKGRTALCVYMHSWVRMSTRLAPSAIIGVDPPPLFCCGSAGRIEKYILRKAFDTPEVRRCHAFNGCISKHFFRIFLSDICLRTCVVVASASFLW